MASICCKLIFGKRRQKWRSRPQWWGHSPGKAGLCLSLLLQGLAGGLECSFLTNGFPSQRSGHPRARPQPSSRWCPGPLIFCTIFCTSIASHTYHFVLGPSTKRIPSPIQTLTPSFWCYFREFCLRRMQSKPDERESWTWREEQLFRTQSNLEQACKVRTLLGGMEPRRTLSPVPSPWPLCEQKVRGKGTLW